MPVRGTRVDDSGQSAKGVSAWDDRADYQRVWAAARDRTSRRVEKWSERDLAPAGLQALELSARTTGGGEESSDLLKRCSFAGSWSWIRGEVDPAAGIAADPGGRKNSSLFISLFCD